MALAVIKAEHLNKRVAFGKSATPLHTREDIDDLAILAIESKDRTLIELFKYLPTLAELKRAKMEALLNRPKKL